ncbi:MAG: transporter substrate-binding domain-containing protein [Proteobacteria bacterium]|nr:transporter substrate-binding domain-containing protein [Pseudomonadota bacterium]
MRKILLSFLFLLLSQNAKADTISLAADEWCPYNCAAKSADLGILIDVAKEVFEKAGHKIDYQNVPWTRAKEAARAGQFTGIVGAYKEDAPDFVFPEKGILKSSNDFFVTPQATWKYNGLDSLKTISLGVIKDYSYGTEIDAYIKQNEKDSGKIQMLSGDDALQKNIEKLLAGRITVVLEDAAVFNYQLKEMNKVGQAVSAGSSGEDDVYIAFSPKSPKAAEYAKLLTEGLKTLEQSGKLAEIIKKYK